MHLFYADESYDQTKFVLSAIRIAATDWRNLLVKTKEFRAELRSDHGIKLRAELHAQTFVRHISDGVASRTLTISERRVIFERCIDFICTLPIEIINVCLPLANFRNNSHEAHFAALDRLLNRVHTNVDRLNPCSLAMVIFDAGKEREITKLSRRLSVYNQIPSQFGSWPGGGRAKNIALVRIIEDPIFRDSKDSYFLQLVDFVTFALLKREVPATEFIKKWGYEKLFDKLKPVLCIAASPRDPCGIVRG